MKQTDRIKITGLSSIKEGFDNLPSGICFADERGIICLCNRRMHSLSRLMLGTDLQNIYELRRALAAPCADVKVLDIEHFVYRFPDGSVWQFSESSLLSAKSGNTYTQLQAFDVTELVAKKAALEESNALLVEANSRAKQLYNALEQTVHDEELLAMKIKIHDDFGTSLLAARQCLEQDGGLEKIRESASVWEKAVASLGHWSKEQPKPISVSGGSKVWYDILLQAKKIGVTLRLLPGLDAAKCAEPYYAAVRESVTNCVRHAGGDEVCALFETNSLTVTNNGRPPEGEISEGGGLSTLRRLVEQTGGSMTIKSQPRFVLRIDYAEGSTMA